MREAPEPPPLPRRLPLYGYARVSTIDQDLAVQRAALKAAGCDVIRAEQVSSARRDGRSEHMIHDRPYHLAQRRISRPQRVWFIDQPTELLGWLQASHGCPAILVSWPVNID